MRTYLSTLKTHTNYKNTAPSPQHRHRFLQTPGLTRASGYQKRIIIEEEKKSGNLFTRYILRVLCRCCVPADTVVPIRQQALSSTSLKHEAVFQRRRCVLYVTPDAYYTNRYGRGAYCTILYQVLYSAVPYCTVRVLYWTHLAFAPDLPSAAAPVHQP